MEARVILSLSENDIVPEPGTEEPLPETEPGETVTPPTEEGQDPVADPETPPGEEEQKPGEDTEQEPPAEETGSGEGSIPEKDIQELLDGINARFEQRDVDVAELTESIRSLVDLMSVEPYSTPGYVYVPPEIPIEGYKEWDYPIIVDYLISIVGYGDPIPQSNDYDDPDQFLEDFQAFAFECYKGDVYSEFTIDKVWGADGQKLYDSQGMEEPEPEPGEEEPNETVELLLSHLEDISTILEEMQQADLEYYQAVYDYQAEMREINATETACTIFICVAVIAIFATLLWSELFRRFK